jgi:hypothetical protein
MKKVLGSGGDAEIAAMISEVDQDGDGTVDYEVPGDFPNLDLMVDLQKDIF